MKDSSSFLKSSLSGLEFNDSHLLQMVLDNSNSPFILLDLEGNIRLFNKKANELTQFHKKESLVTGESFFSHLSDDRIPVVKQIFSRALTGETVEYIFKYKNTDPPAVFSLQYSPVRDSQGEIVAIMINGDNISSETLVLEKASEDLKKLSLIARETQNAVVITDAEGYIQWVNEAFTRITEYSEQEAMGKKPGSLLQGEHTSQVAIDYMRRKIKSVEPFSCDIINYSKSGKEYWMRIQCQPQFDASGTLHSFFAIQTDVSYEKQAEQSLINSERKFRALIEKSKDGLSVITREGKVLDISVAGCKMLGYTKETYFGENVAELIHPSDQKKVSAIFERVINKPDNTAVVDYRFRKADGDYVWIESTFHNLLHEPDIHAVVIHFRDISLRKKTEELLQSSEQKYRNLFQNNPSAMFIWNPLDLTIVEVNEAATVEYGYSREDFLKMTIASLGNRGSKEEMQGIAANILSNEHFTTSGIWHHLTKDKEGRYMDIAFQALDYFGTKAGLAIVRNITDQVELERKLANERMRRQHEITAAVITALERDRHDLGKELHDNINQILATTRLYIEYAQTNEAMRQNLLESAKGFIVRAVNEIRNLSKSLVPPSLGEIGLIRALEELVDSIKELGKYEFHVDWGKYFDEDTISEQLKLTIFRIVQEQLSNIMKHSDAKNIWIKINASQSRLLLIVKDDGQGFGTAQQSTGVGF